MCPGRITTKPQTHSSPSPPLKPAFDILDADHDGKISSNDLRSFYTSFSNSADQNMIDSMISVADLDKNGFVEFDEFENVVFKVEKKKNRGVGVLVEEMFKAMDGDGDGKVGFEDLKRWFGLMKMDVSESEIMEMVGGCGGGGVSCDVFRKILGFEAEEDRRGLGQRDVVCDV